MRWVGLGRTERCGRLFKLMLYRVRVKHPLCREKTQDEQAGR